MSSLWIVDSHLAWPLFAAIAYSTIGVLVADYAWRVWQAPKAIFIGIAGSVWACGLVMIVYLG